MNTSEPSPPAGPVARAHGGAQASPSGPADRDELALHVTFELQPLNDALISLGVAATGAQKAARAVRPSDPAADVTAAWACHATLINECSRLVETRANVLIEAVQRLIRAR